MGYPVAGVPTNRAPAVVPHTVDGSGNATAAGSRVNPLAVAGAMVADTLMATIANGAALSDGIDCGTLRAVRLRIPAAWTAANLTVLSSSDGITFNDLYDRFGAEYTIAVGGASRSILLPFADFVGLRYFKLRSGTTAAPVNQGAERSIVIALVA